VLNNIHNLVETDQEREGEGSEAGLPRHHVAPALAGGASLRTPAPARAGAGAGSARRGGGGGSPEAAAAREAARAVAAQCLEAFAVMAPRAEHGGSGGGGAAWCPPASPPPPFVLIGHAASFTPY